MGNTEVRQVSMGVELREDGDGPVISGHASTFGDPYDVGFFTETIAPGAFTRTLSGNPDVRLLVNHEGLPLARTSSGTLKLSADARGLAVEAKLDPTDPDVQALLPKMRRGDLNQMSFAFNVPKGGDEWDYSASPVTRKINEINLSGGDVSIVTYPANPNATISVRSDCELDNAETFVQGILREARDGQVFTDDLKLKLEQALETLNLRASDPQKPYGDVEYADPGYQADGKHRYPIDSADHVRAAWSYINQSSNQSPYTAEQLSNIKSRIMDAAKKFGVEISSDQQANAAAEENESRVYAVAFARALMGE